jgi:hypothetical protein
MLQVKKAGLRSQPGPLCTDNTGMWLPEEVPDDVHNPAIAQIDEQDIVIIADPPVGTISRRQAILPRIVDPVARSVIAGAERETDAYPAVTPTAIGRIIAPGAIIIAITFAVTAPVIPAVVTPVAAPAIYAVVVVAIVTTVDIAVAIPVVTAVKAVVVVPVVTAIKVAIAVAIPVTVKSLVIVAIPTAVEITVAVSIPTPVEIAVAIAIPAAVKIAVTVTVVIAAIGLSARPLLTTDFAPLAIATVAFLKPLVVLGRLLLRGLSALLTNFATTASAFTAAPASLIAIAVTSAAFAALERRIVI